MSQKQTTQRIRFFSDSLDDNDISLINKADRMISIAVVENTKIDNSLSICPEFICPLAMKIPEDPVLLVSKGDTSTQNETVLIRMN